ncbi:MAG TPA: hypothetical protein PL151_14535 [Phycisphaerae bacterium]|nr:hypothetical protein [Phycisphaerae bacterium]HOJ72903.1 hypothetical protein [Phycisphaerae bacterium]HOM50087.1 hypothetical protein [Phycisphaerae bacterium]HOQ88344.1 hypothetical protein [Phycisphaerae bacterium]HPP26610.1 hypothetical protein [Phycisphaerae bacterium]
MVAIALVSDLIFGTRIKSTADELGLPMSVVRTAEAVESAAHAGLNVVIIDLSVEGIDPVDVIRRCKQAGRSPGDESVVGSDDAAANPMVIAFGSHVQKDLLHAAEQAGADLVLPRSRFTAELPQLLARYAQMGQHR